VGVGSPVVFSNGSWSTPTSQALLDNVFGLSCSAPSFCVAVGGNGSSNNGDAVTYR
jgi:hypothetical protein